MEILSLSQLIIKLHDAKALKFGSYTLKSGVKSPVYFDLRVIVSYPELMVQVSEFLWKAVLEADCQFDNVCGVPYTALPLATLIAANHKYPMLIRRKEAKDYGTKKIIEGHFKQGDVCLIVEDVVTSGSSVLETVQSLNNEGIVVKDAVVLLDREQGGRQRLASQKVNLHSVCSISKLLEILLNAGRLSDETVEDVRDFITSNNTFTLPAEVETSAQQKRKTNIVDGCDEVHSKRNKKHLSYGERSDMCSHPVTKKLFNIMHMKETNLAFSADVTSFNQLYQLTDAVGPHICVLKTHIDIVEDFSMECVKKLQELAKKHNFLIFEDRKFADIGNTVKHQYSGGVHRISQWAHFINAHVLPGPGVITGLREVGLPLQRGCLLVGEMSSKGNLITETYTKSTVEMAENHSDFVIGFICQSKLSDNPEFIHMTPGVKIEQGGDDLGQQYLTPTKVIHDKKSDIIIVGRGILSAEDPAEQARLYKEAGYQAYLQLLS